MEEKLFSHIQQIIRLRLVNEQKHKKQRETSLFLFKGTHRCVKGQGMINMRTHETGDLIVQFDVEFPSEKFLNDAEEFKKLESLLPKRAHIDIPKGEHVEDVQLIDFHTTKSAHRDRHGGYRREAYNAEDSDEEGTAHPGVHACRSQ